MIDFELAFINTEHPDFACKKKDLLKLIAKALGCDEIESNNGKAMTASHPSVAPVSPPSSLTSSLASSSSTRAGGQASRHQYDATPPPQSKASRSPEAFDHEIGSPPEQPFWSGWLGGQQQQAMSAQPNPRRGGRRSSFALMDPSELESFRASQFNCPTVPEVPISTTTSMPPSRETCENTQVELVKEMIKAYFSIVARDITDKVILYCK